MTSVKIVQHSNIPVGKGLSDGSTNILSVLLALNKFHRTTFEKKVLYEICAKILPTDPVLDKEIDLIFNPLTGEKVFNLIPKPFGIIYFDSDYSTLINPKEIFRKLDYTSADYIAFNEILEHFQKGSILNNYQLIFKAITMSSKINQKALPKPNFEKIIEFAEANKMGVFVGHTGTVMGLLMGADVMEQKFNKVKAFIRETWNAKAYYDSCEQNIIKIL